ncbi:hypothetical protein WDW86_13480 [Bdellovibrionota bacterium FG-2]
MNFSEFLKERRAQKNIATSKDHYEELGGEKVLGISLRHFQQIESGKHPPSEALLTILFSKVPASARRTVVLAYFLSVFSDNNANKPLLSYLEQHLSPAIESESKSLWESTKRLMMYSEEQLDYLTQNPDALRFHRRILLLDREPKDQCPLTKEKLKKMVSLDLITISGNEILPSRTVYRIPHFDNSSPRLVGKATDYIFKQVEVYSAREGAADQELSYAMQMVSHSTAERILEQMRVFKRWVQSLASTDVGPGVSPLLFVGLVRKIDRREL